MEKQLMLHQKQEKASKSTLLTRAVKFNNNGKLYTLTKLQSMPLKVSMRSSASTSTDLSTSDHDSHLRVAECVGANNVVLRRWRNNVAAQQWYFDGILKTVKSN
jgi:hypothetical protein